MKTCITTFPVTVNIRTPKNFSVINLNFEKYGSMHKKDADGMANSVDLAQAYLFENLGSLW